MTRLEELISGTAPRTLPTGEAPLLCNHLGNKNKTPTLNVCYVVIIIRVKRDVVIQSGIGLSEYNCLKADVPHVTVSPFP